MENKNNSNGFFLPVLSLCFLCFSVKSGIFFPVTLKVYYRTGLSFTICGRIAGYFAELFYSYVLFLCYKYKAYHSESGSSKNTDICHVFTE